MICSAVENPHHSHHEGALNLKLPFDVISENYHTTNPSILVIDDFMNLEALQKLKTSDIEARAVLIP